MIVNQLALKRQATVLGLLPMAVAVIFGLAVATLLTLVVVPVLCSIAQSLKSGRSRGGN